MSAPVYYTADMVRAMPSDGNRYETVHGELLVTPAPRPWHQVVVERMRHALAVYLDDHRDLFLFASAADISWGPDVLVQPDLFVLPTTEAKTLDWSQMQGLILAIEVLSPATARHDRFTKRRLYQEVGIPCYWVVDADQRFVETWRPGRTVPQLVHNVLSWTPPSASAGFQLSLDTLFAPIG
jgi:Uma2 family endonuclease